VQLRVTILSDVEAKNRAIRQAFEKLAILAVGDSRKLQWRVAFKAISCRKITEIVCSLFQKYKLHLLRCAIASQVLFLSYTWTQHERVVPPSWLSCISSGP